MASGTYTVDCTSGVYTQLTTASSGYALIYNPQSSQGRLAIHVGTSAPDDAVKTFMVLNPDEAFPRTSDIDNHIWGKFLEGGTGHAVVVEDQA